MPQGSCSIRKSAPLVMCSRTLRRRRIVVGGSKGRCRKVLVLGSLLHL